MLLTVYVIVVVPIARPFTTPVVPSIVAIAVLLLLHVPPVVAFESAVVEPIQTCVLPDIPGTTGIAYTVSGAIAVPGQPNALVTVYVMLTTPAETPFTIPVDRPTVATDMLLLVQLPPGVVFAFVIEVPTQCAVGPVIAGITGVGLTVTTLVVNAVPHRLVTL
jgi:hypothetical protein